MNEWTQELINFCNFKLEDYTSSIMYESTRAQARTRVHVPTFLLLIIRVLIFHLRPYQCEQFIHMYHYYINLQTNRSVFLFNFVEWPTNAQLFHKLSHSYMFWHHCVILSTYLASTTVASTYRLYIRPPQTGRLHENCSDIKISAHFIVNRTILML